MERKSWREHIEEDSLSIAESRKHTQRLLVEYKTEMRDAPEIRAAYETTVGYDDRYNLSGKNIPNGLTNFRRGNARWRLTYHNESYGDSRSSTKLLSATSNYLWLCRFHSDDDLVFEQVRVGVGYVPVVGSTHIIEYKHVDHHKKILLLQHNTEKAIQGAEKVLIEFRNAGTKQQRLKGECEKGSSRLTRWRNG